MAIRPAGHVKRIVADLAQNPDFSAVFWVPKDYWAQRGSIPGWIAESRRAMTYAMQKQLETALGGALGGSKVPDIIRPSKVGRHALAKCDYRN